MPYNLSKAELPDYLEYIQDRLKKNREEIDRLISVKVELEERIDKIKAHIQEPDVEETQIDYPEGYSDKMLWLDKIKYIINSAGRGLTTTEIIDELVKIEPKYKEDRQTAMRSVSGTVSAKSKPGGELTKVENDRKEYVYSIAENKLAILKTHFESLREKYGHANELSISTHKEHE